MPLRNDASLWFNMAGTVACYQPVAAPGPLLARYNMRAGGTNAFRCEAATLPAWSAAAGWTCTTNTVLTTGVVPDSSATGMWSLIVAATPAVTNAQQYVLGQGGNYWEGIMAALGQGQGPQWANRTKYIATAPAYVAGMRYTLGVTETSGYLNGKFYASIVGGGNALTTQLQFGRSTLGLQGTIQAAVIVSRVLSAADMWTASRQMAYCDVNPDFSVWGRRRRWYYGQGVGGFQAAWARGSNSYIGGSGVGA